jgi:hypothetical protein
MASNQMPSSVQIHNLRFVQKSRLSDPIGGDEEVSHPPELLQQSSDVQTCAYATIIKSQQQPAPLPVGWWIQSTAGPFRGPHNLFQMTLEFLAAQLVDMGVRFLKAAELILLPRNDIVI